ncbi:hypothetical protein PAPYR_8854 [Paratrimastix pyriformis]|uniref:Uncharacterized protein n=1 Tax=Paratrimastix pyriformis TaxID=342808 RepID=A0ABQ8U9V1_9EUKA|nr:hypothetical protein PAPYR_8854 [Paratrimastix pyriformis]
MRCDLLIAQKDKSTAGTDMTCQILFDKFLDVSAVFCVLAVQVFTLSWFGGLQDILVSSLPYLVYSSYSFFSPFFGSSPLPFRLSQDSSFLYQ